MYFLCIDHNICFNFDLHIYTLLLWISCITNNNLLIVLSLLFKLVENSWFYDSKFKHAVLITRNKHIFIHFTACFQSSVKNICLVLNIIMKNRMSRIVVYCLYIVVKIRNIFLSFNRNW